MIESKSHVPFMQVQFPLLPPRRASSRMKEGIFILSRSAHFAASPFQNDRLDRLKYHV